MSELHPAAMSGTSAEEPRSDLAALGVPQRRRLPDTRPSITHKFNINGYEGYISVGLFEDGRPGEVFLKMAKEGSTVSGLMDTIGVLTSLALQYGVSVETLAAKFEGTHFEPMGWTSNSNLREVTSIADYIFRWLRSEFLSTNHDSQHS
ncbi:MAG: hypothetical protein WD851_17345 [Pirellulales bacterium]